MGHIVNYNCIKRSGLLVDENQQEIQFTYHELGELAKGDKVYFNIELCVDGLRATEVAKNWST